MVYTLLRTLVNVCSLPESPLSAAHFARCEGSCHSMTAQLQTKLFDAL